MKLRNLLITFIFLLSTFYLISCDTTDPGDPPEVRPSGYQEDIPWPSLADSPWPMFHGNPQSNGRSKFIGPQTGEVEFVLDGFNLESGLALGNDSTFYVADSYELFAISSKGDTMWTFPYEERCYTGTNPVITADNSVLITYGCGYIQAVSTTGEARWKYKLKNSISSHNINIDYQGNIYAVDLGKTLYCLNESGELLWDIYDERILASSSISISPNSDKIYLSGDNVSILCIDISTNEILWTFGEVSYSRAPLIDSKGHIYLTSGSLVDQAKIGLYSLDEDGAVRWFLPHNEWREIAGRFRLLQPEMTMDIEGNLYFALDTLYSVSFDGKLNWKKYMGPTSTPITCDAKGTLYYFKYESLGFTLNSIDSKNATNYWSKYFNEPNAYLPNLSPALANGVMYLPTQGRLIYKIK